MKNKPVRLLSALLILFLSLGAWIWPHLPASDQAQYFNFADRRFLFGIPNAMDVISNVGFLLTVIYGFSLLAKRRETLPREYWNFGSLIAWSTLFTFAGSSYFHLLPNGERLFWDRLPMTVVFSSIMGLVLLDRIDKKVGLIVSSLLIPFALFAVIGWDYGWISLRPYIALQYGGILFIILVMCLQPQGRIRNTTLWSVIGLYGLAKIFEVFDGPTFELFGVISGHSIKHILAALAMFKLLSSFREEKS